MKRHESIVTLSREHHFGLLFCWKIRQGIKKQVPIERIKKYIEYFWGNHLQRHFYEDETLLFNLLQDRLVDQAIAEHTHISQLIEATITNELTHGHQLNILADTLDDHIRFEERILFPHFEKELPQTKLTTLGTQLEKLHQGREKDEYPDEFWI